MDRVTVKFLDHVLGTPGPDSFYLKGQVAEVTDEVVKWVRCLCSYDPDPQPVGIIVASDIETTLCKSCDKRFHPDMFEDHIQFYHVRKTPELQIEPKEKKHPAIAAAESANDRKERGDGDYICIDCRRRFETPLGLKVHRGHVHKLTDNEKMMSGTGSP